jgi:hypothetical protein
VNDFTCKEDLVDCLIGSCWIPFYMHQAATVLLKHRGKASTLVFTALSSEQRMPGTYILDMVYIHI